MNSTDRRFCIVLGQRVSWPEMLSRALETEALGFDALFLVDHFYGLMNLDDPTHEAYTMLGALAPFTQRIRLGVMVAGNTYRNPAFLLKQAITVDHVSGGRVDFGVGAGWVEREHEAYGWEFPSAKGRVDRFEEALEIWDALQRNERTTYEGEHYQLTDAPFQPKSLQGRLPVLIGGTQPRMMKLTARFADMWNTMGTPEDARAGNERMDEVCRSIGRDPKTLVRTVSPSLNLLTSVDAFVSGVSAYHEAGIRDIYMPWPRVEAELPVLRQIARDVLPTLRGEDRASSAPGSSRFEVAEASPDAVKAVLAGISDPTQRAILDWLMDHPDERFDGSALQSALAIPVHLEVTRAVAGLGSRFFEAGLARPWNEAQRGYLLPADRAHILRSLR
ncbi:MAG: LLM class flavin-dependent oxidoreductase [Thermomicrobiales bacterium]|nr:LLM class flavin-dependent oxidoreductase [Thermomicrobiales bacterium]